MRIFIICFLFFRLSLSFGQHVEKFSAEIDIGYTYYYISNNRADYFNYGISTLISYNIDKYALSTGINYSTKNSYYNVVPDASNNFLKKRDYDLQYINIPILFKFGEHSVKKISYRLISGFVFNHIVNYDITSYYLNNTPALEKDVKASQKTGISLRLGGNLSHHLRNKICVNLSPFIDYKFELDHKDYYRPDYKQLTDDRFSFGIKLGIEYFF